MLLILELALLGSGLYALYKGKIPDFLPGSHDYQVSGDRIRLLGWLMMIPLPGAFVTNILLDLIVDDPGLGERAAYIIELVITIGMVALVMAIYMASREPVEPDSDHLES